MLPPPPVVPTTRQALGTRDVLSYRTHAYTRRIGIQDPGSRFISSSTHALAAPSLPPSLMTCFSAPGGRGNLLTGTIPRRKNLTQRPRCGVYKRALEDMNAGQSATQQTCAALERLARAGALSSDLSRAGARARARGCFCRDWCCNALAAFKSRALEEDRIQRGLMGGKATRGGRMRVQRKRIRMGRGRGPTEQDDGIRCARGAPCVRAAYAEREQKSGRQ